MSTKRSGFKVILLALAAIMLLSLPLAAGAAEANGITSPANGATVSGVVDVKGYASDPAFAKWQLDVLPGGDANARDLPGGGREAGRVQLHHGHQSLPER